MKDHYRVLDLPKGASEEQIKIQYKLLVRVYHPDRFTKPEDKAYAEQKIKEINEAYSALIRTPTDSSGSTNSEQPVPVVIPAYIDFGTIIVGERRTIPLTVSNARGEIEDLQFDFSETQWFTLNENRLLTDNSKSPLQFEVIATTNTMTPGRTYKGWIDVRMKNNVTRVNLSMKVVNDLSEATSKSALVRNGLLGLALLGVAAGAAYFGPQFLNSTGNPGAASSAAAVANTGDSAQPATAEVPAVATQADATRASNPLLSSLVVDNGDVGAAFAESSDHLVYPIFDQNDFALYTSNFDGSSQQRFKFSGQNIAWSADGTRIAYLLPQDGVQQIFVAQSADRTGDQLTNTPNVKSDLVWAPDGSQLAYIQVEEGQRILYLTAPGGRSPRALSNPSAGSVGGFTWSPDGRRLLLDVKNEGRSSIYQVNADGSELKEFASINGYDPAWSPDGKVVLIASEKGLFTFDNSGKQLRQVTTSAARLPRWSSDGAKFAYLELVAGSTTNAKLMVSDSEGKQAEKLADGALVNFAWSPISGRLAYVTGKISTSGLSTLYLWSVMPGEQAKLVAETNDPFITWVP
jgi:Tol biopolymer transport system component